MIDLLIADDHALFREGLRQILSDQPDISVCGEAVDGDSLLKQLRERQCGVLVLDISMPGHNGLGLIGEIRALRPDLPILVLSMHQEQQFAVQAIRAGANGYVTKASSSGELLEGIRRVARGGLYVSEQVVERLAADVQKAGLLPPHADLTEREFQIFHLLVGGDRVSDIARRLALSEKTVSTHKSQIQRKLGVHSVASIVRYAIQHGLVAP